jgi:DNA replication and repair protein RecF
MILSSISLNNVRIHSSFNTNFADKLNYIVGGNGLGKTTILESIYYLCTTKSCLTANDYEVLSFDKNEFMIEGSFKDLTVNNVSFYFSKTENRKKYLLNNKQVNRYSSVIGKFPVVLLMPSDHAITQGSPSERRKFIDSVISQSNRNYLETLIEYNRTLRQRSALLSRRKEFRSEVSEEEINVWTDKLVNKGADLIKYRINFIEKFKSYITESYQKIMDKDETPDIYYQFLEGYTGSDITGHYWKLLNERRDEELRRATNLIGPHRDDFLFNINEQSLRTYGSQGQHKTFQTVLRFAEFFYLKDITGIKPIFLLDDVFGELDAKRAYKISEYLGEVGQAFVTLTDFGNFSFLKAGEEDKIIRLNRDSTANA